VGFLGSYGDAASVASTDRLAGIVGGVVKDVPPSVLATLLSPNLTVKTISSGSFTAGVYTALDADVNCFSQAVLLDVTATGTIRVPNSLTQQGVLLVRCGASSISVKVDGPTITLDLVGGTLNTLTTQYRSMAVTSLGSLTHWWVDGAESAT
jgi:hypothetical protein